MFKEFEQTDPSGSDILEKYTATIAKPSDIEKRSFEILSSMLGDIKFKPMHEPIIKRVIHATADFDFAESLKFTENAIEQAIYSIKSGANIVTDTKMAMAGINKKVLKKYGGQVICYMDDEEVAKEAERKGVTRAIISMEKASLELKNKIYVVGNAPTALIKICELVDKKYITPSLVVGVPVGFVNVVESKDILKKTNANYILTEGRKGGSTVAVAIINAILYMMG